MSKFRFDSYKEYIYKKRFKVVKKYLADDSENKFVVGDVVLIKECKPISKMKNFEVVEKVGADKFIDVEIKGEEILNTKAKKEEDKEEKKD